MTDKAQDFERMLVFLASGLVELHDQTLSGDSIRRPYPKLLEQGMHKLAAIQVDKGMSPLRGLQDLLDLAHKPLVEWNLELPKEFAEATDKLLDLGLPTNFCLQWMHEQGADAYEQEQLLPKVIGICRQSQQPEAYSYFRMMLIREPVIDSMRLQEAKMEQPLRLLAGELSEAYIPAPLSAAQDDFFQLCQHCGSLLLRVEGGEFQCENERCRLQGMRAGKKMKANSGVLWLMAGIRRYVAQPGLAEVELQEALEKLGVSIEMWPNFDAYDLRLTMGGEVWAVDVKDWTNPIRLARQAGALRQKPSWDRAFYVFPDERKRQRSDYLRAFEHHWQKPPRTTAMMQRDFLREVRQKMEAK